MSIRATPILPDHPTRADEMIGTPHTHLCTCPPNSIHTQGREPRPTGAIEVSAVRDSAQGTSRTSAALISRGPPRDLPTDARSIAGQCSPMSGALNVPAPTPRAGKMRMREKIPKYLSAWIDRARPTRPAFLQIPGFRNLGFVVSGGEGGSRV